MTSWRTILLSLVDDAIALALMAIALAWLTSANYLQPAVALVLGALGAAVVLIIAYKSTVALTLRPKVGTGMVGRKGVAATEIAPDGMVLIDGELWKASSREPIAKGAAITVVGAKGLQLEASEDKNS